MNDVTSAALSPNTRVFHESAVMPTIAAFAPESDACWSMHSAYLALASASCIAGAKPAAIPLFILSTHTIQSAALLNPASLPASVVDVFVTISSND